jgi:hypothetical protein
MTQTGVFAMPHPTLTPIIGTPNAKVLIKMMKEVYNNAQSVYSARGGGVYGHLALVMSAANYAVLPNTQPYQVPVHPGNAPVHAPNATQHQIAETNRQYQQDIQDHATHVAVINTIKKQLLAAIEPRFVEILEDDVLGFMHVMPLKILNHLQTEYGTITRDDVELNRMSLEATWNPDGPIEDIWTRIAHARNYAERAEQPLTDDAIITLTLQTFQQTGVFSNAIDKWNELADDAQTFEMFKTHFNRATKHVSKN